MQPQLRSRFARTAAPVVAILLVAACASGSNGGQGATTQGPGASAPQATAGTGQTSATGSQASTTGQASTAAGGSAAATGQAAPAAGQSTSTTAQAGQAAPAAGQGNASASQASAPAGQTAASGAQGSTASGVAQATAAPARSQSAAAQASGARNPAAAVFQQNGASVVNITSIALVRTGQGQTAQPQGIGSGFIIDADGRIVTNNHVVEDAAQLAVTFQDKTTTPATLVGRDPDNDLAVIQVDPNAADDSGGTIRSRIKPVTLGNSDQVVVGDTTVAIGSPLGLQQTVTEGIVSALREPGEESAVPSEELDLLGGAVQTDAAINPGNSGGPLFNADGQVIGVNRAILSQSGGSEGIGFAIPTNVVTRVAPELIQTGRYRHPMLGVQTLALAQIGSAARQQLGIPANQSGLLVVGVTGPAQQAGLRGGSRTVSLGGDQVPAGGDIIVAVDGRPVKTGGDLRAYIENTKHPGDGVTLTVLRDGQRTDLQSALAERPQQQQEASQPQAPQRGR